MVFVILLASEVAVLTAVIVTVPVTLAGVVTLEVVLLLPPPHPVINIAESNAVPANGPRPRFFAAASPVASISARALSGNSKLPPGGTLRHGFDPSLEVVFAFAIVTVVLPDPVTDPGIVHVVLVSVDGTEQVNETVPVNPPTAATVTVAVPEDESATVSVDGLMENV
jgi:hypothetical protein